MKFFFALAALALAVANAADCDLTKVAPLLSDPNVKQCTTDTGFSPPIPPTSAMMPKVCASKACQAALTTLKGLGLGDCVVVGVKLETDLINPIDKACAASAPAPASTPAPASAPTSATPSTTTAPGTPSAATPAPATKKPVC
ncbi:Elicitin-like protein [Globisporangium polare]